MLCVIIIIIIIIVVVVVIVFVIIVIVDLWSYEVLEHVFSLLKYVGKVTSVISEQLLNWTFSTLWNMHV